MILHTTGLAVSVGNEIDLMIFVLVGRRIDLPDAETVRFPLRNVGLVRNRLFALLERQPAGTLVCSAACGADLLALEAAGQLGWRRFVILPFDRDAGLLRRLRSRPARAGGGWAVGVETFRDFAFRSGSLSGHVGHGPSRRLGSPLRPDSG